MKSLILQTVYAILLLQKVSCLIIDNEEDLIFNEILPNQNFAEIFQVSLASQFSSTSVSDTSYPRATVTFQAQNKILASDISRSFDSYRPQKTRKPKKFITGQKNEIDPDVDQISVKSEIASPTQEITASETIIASPTEKITASSGTGKIFKIHQKNVLDNDANEVKSSLTSFLILPTEVVKPKPHSAVSNKPSINTKSGIQNVADNSNIQKSFVLNIKSQAENQSENFPSLDEVSGRASDIQQKEEMETNSTSLEPKMSSNATVSGTYNPDENNSQQSSNIVIAVGLSGGIAALILMGIIYKYRNNTDHENGPDRPQSVIDLIYKRTSAISMTKSNESKDIIENRDSSASYAPFKNRFTIVEKEYRNRESGLTFRSDSSDAFSIKSYSSDIIHAPRRKLTGESCSSRTSEISSTAEIATPGTTEVWFFEDRESVTKVKPSLFIHTQKSFKSPETKEINIFSPIQTSVKLHFDGVDVDEYSENTLNRDQTDYFEISIENLSKTEILRIQKENETIDINPGVQKVHRLSKINSPIMIEGSGSSQVKVQKNNKSGFIAQETPRDNDKVFIF